MFYWVLCRWRPALQEHWYISSLWKATASSNSEDGTRELVSVCSFFACSPLVEGLQSISFLFLQKKKTIYGKISVSDCMCLRLSSVPLQSVSSTFWLFRSTLWGSRGPDRTCTHPLLASATGLPVQACLVACLSLRHLCEHDAVVHMLPCSLGDGQHAQGNGCHVVLPVLHRCPHWLHPKNCPPPGW